MVVAHSEDNDVFLFFKLLLLLNLLFQIMLLQ